MSSEINPLTNSFLQTFEIILDFYRNGEFIVPPNIHKKLLRHELEFWQLSIGADGKHTKGPDEIDKVPREREEEEEEDTEGIEERKGRRETGTKSLFSLLDCSDGD